MPPTLPFGIVACTFSDILSAAALSYKLIKFLTISFFFCQDVNLQKQTMRDAFIDGMMAKAEGNKTGDTEKQPSRKQSFPRRFIQALFSNEENDENIAGEQLPTDIKSLNESASKRSGEIDGCSSFKPKDQSEDEMLKGVKSLPNERKISVLVSIVYGLIGVDPATDEQMNEESKMDTNSESPGNIVDKVNGIQGTNIGIGATDFTANRLQFLSSTLVWTMKDISVKQNWVFLRYKPTRSKQFPELHLVTSNLHVQFRPNLRQYEPGSRIHIYIRWFRFLVFFLLLLFYIWICKFFCLKLVTHPVLIENFVCLWFLHVGGYHLYVHNVCHKPGVCLSSIVSYLQSTVWKGRGRG